MYRFRFFSVLVVVALVALSLPLHDAVGAQRPAVRALPAVGATLPQAAVPAASVDLDCATSPFGRRLAVGRENEIFLNYTTAAGDAGYTRLDFQNNALVVGRTWSDAANATLRTTGRLGAVVVDRTGDNQADVLQALQNTAGAFTLVTHDPDAIGNTPPYTVTTVSGPASRVLFTATAGNVRRVTDLVGSISIVGSVRRAAQGPGQAANYVEVRTAYGSEFWRDEALKDAIDIQVATGDLDLDGFDDEIVLVAQLASSLELRVLEYDATYQTPNENFLRLRGSASISVGRPLAARLAVGNIDADYEDEVVLAFSEDQSDNQGVASSIRMQSFDYNKLNQTLVQRNEWLKNSNLNGKSLGLGIGDVDADGLGEVVVGYLNFANGPGVLAVQTLDAEFATVGVPSGGYWEGVAGATAINFSTTHSLSLAVDDLNRDGQHEIAAAFRPDNAHFRVALLGRVGTAALGSRATLEQNGTVNWLQVGLGDVDNDSLIATYGPVTGSTLQCKRVTETQITSAVFAPPYWENIQQRGGSTPAFGSIGESRSVGQGSGTTVVNSYSHSVSVYVGAGVDAGVVQAQVKATGGYEFAASNASGRSNYTTETTTEGWEANGNFVVFDKVVYDCYVYVLAQSGQPAQGSARFCAANAVTNETAAQLDTWDTSFSQVTDANALTYAPVAPDWSSLALFRGAATAQSSTAFGGAPSRAVDGTTAGEYTQNSVTHTNQEAQPWWQVDLGTAQPISKLRLWNRSGACDAGLCRTRLSNFRVFVSDSDFRVISNNPAVLADDPRVRSYEYTGTAGEVVSLNTLQANFQPISGRFVRVQLLGTGVLSLAEVQVFGPNHVEPQRYPRDMRDTVPNDGFFEVELYNPLLNQYQWVRQRGKLVWNGAKQGGGFVLGSQVIGQGQAVPSWSRTQENGGAFSESSTIGHTGKVGVEVEVSGGLVAQVSAGVSYEYTQGVEREQTTERTWGQAFEIGGGVESFPQNVNGQLVNWDGVCAYKIRPYYYELTETANYGTLHRFLMVDYLVPEAGGGLNRQANLAPCRYGEYNNGTNQRPVAQPDTFTIPNTGATTLAVLANDSDPNAGTTLALLEVGGPAQGTARIVNNQIVYTPYPNVVGSDSFTYRITDGILTAVATITLTITNAPTPSATPQPGGATPTPSATTQPGGATPTPTVTVQPGGATPTPTVTMQPGGATPTPQPTVPGSAANRVYLPFVRR